jgi:acetylglutamate kinase
VVKLGGAALDGGIDAVLDALAQLHASAPVILVHGGGKIVDELLAKLGMTSKRIDGLRVTTPEQIDLIAGVLGGTVNKRLVGALIRRRVGAVGIGLSDAGEIAVEPLTHPEGDLGRVGRVVLERAPGGEDERPELLRTLLEAGYLPVVSSIGMDSSGELYNVNADDAASALAGVLGASSLVLLTDVDGIRGADGTVIEQIDQVGVELLIEQGVIAGGMIPKARGAIEAAERSGADVVIASWRSPGALASLTGRGADEAWGTRVTPAGETRVGPARSMNVEAAE